MFFRQPPAWVEVADVPDHPTYVDDAISRLEGEKAAIALATALKADLLLIDDREGATVARRVGLAVTGTLGVLDLAAGRGLVDLEQVFDRLRRTSFRRPEHVMAALLGRHTTASNRPSPARRRAAVKISRRQKLSGRVRCRSIRRRVRSGLPCLINHAADPPNYWERRFPSTTPCEWVPAICRCAMRPGTSGGCKHLISNLSTLCFCLCYAPIHVCQMPIVLADCIVCLLFRASSPIRGSRPRYSRIQERLYDNQRWRKASLSGGRDWPSDAVPAGLDRGGGVLGSTNAFVRRIMASSCRRSPISGCI